MRTAILEKKLAEFVQTFMTTRFPKSSDLPGWIRDALGSEKLYVTYENPMKGLGGLGKDQGRKRKREEEGREEGEEKRGKV
eukprot:CAMPEP_0201532886 /NCGR_PEP_ID=MMETSP0161_2-20130828/51528_1 /ASSEMBLY_ACC=CAM_ASM_000251 /TAXON_ID=180227 /ORGANISM="Neoparamoeba aestuarina, Strain SoJaBio B1-5/56/2" /LENGTH=80 /DNA_ID=CAMNT_0047936545 /DNA_START=1088 /DNA_END=1330 /DNA_ORIENTATION=-